MVSSIVGTILECRCISQLKLFQILHVNKRKRKEYIGRKTKKQQQKVGKSDTLKEWEKKIESGSDSKKSSCVVYLVNYL